jgi:IS5 family transposase
MRTTGVPQPSFADLELQAQGLALDATLQTIATLLTQQATLASLVLADLQHGLRHPRAGRPGLTAEQVLRTFILQRLKNWDLRELRERVADGYTLRLFTGFLAAPVPRHDALHRAFCRLTPDTVRAINDLLIRWAVAEGLEDGTKLRADTTVVETTIHYPTDSTLLWDGVRVITRLVRRLQALRPDLSVGFVNRTRSARRRMQEIQRLTPTQRPTQQRAKYRALLRIAEAVVPTARAVVAAAQAAPCTALSPTAAAQCAALQEEIAVYGDRTQRVIDQTRRRVLDGDTVPNEEKLFSIFEPHTDLIKRGKAQKPVEFGHKVFLAESGRGLITDYRVLDGNPVDASQLGPALDRHGELFGIPLRLCAMDRGFFSAQAPATCEAAGVAVECIPQRGGHKSAARTAYEKSRSFRQGQRFRAGIEGRISVLFRGRGMKRCPLHGRERFALFVGAAVLANNLLILAALVHRRAARRRRPAA